ncbi:MAG: hypothetical protein Fur005_47210 [Roseiflexaceae bacterium]
MEQRRTLFVPLVAIDLHAPIEQGTNSGGDRQAINRFGWGGITVWQLLGLVIRHVLSLSAP